MIKRIPEKFKEANFGTGSVGASDVAESAIHLASADPTAASDTGSGFVVGSIWVNTSSGQQFVATSVSAEDATWYGQEGDIINEPFKIQGSTSGFNYCWSDPGAYPNVINKLSFTSDGDSTDVGESLAGSYANYGSIRNTTHIYHAGLVNGPGVPAASKASIWRFAVSSPHVSADVGEHSQAPLSPAIGNWGGTTDGVYGFTHGGQKTDSTDFDHIEKFTLASPAPSSDTSAELTASRHGAVGVSDVSNGYGYAMGGESWPPTSTKNIIEKYAFASTADGADVGDLTSARKSGGSFASTSRAFMAGGAPAPAASNIIDSVPFSSDGNASDWGDLTQARGHMSGCQSTTHGYQEGGASPSMVDTIDKVSHSSPGNATDVGEAPSSNKGGSMSEI